MYDYEDDNRQPAHIDMTRMPCGGAGYFAAPFVNDDVSDERCSWCDNDCTVQLVHRRDHNIEMACDSHADQYFFSARIGVIIYHS